MTHGRVFPIHLNRLQILPNKRRLSLRVHVIQHTTGIGRPVSIKIATTSARAPIQRSPCFRVLCALGGLPLQRQRQIGRNNARARGQ